MKRILSIALLTALVFGSSQAITTAEESQKSSSINSRVRIHTQQNTSDDGQETRNSLLVSVQGSGEASQLTELKTTLQARLEKSGLPVESQQQATDEILRKLEELTSSNPTWAGLITWTSKSPGESNVTFEAGDEASKANEQQGLSGNIRQRLAQGADRLGESMNRMSDRVRQLQQNTTSQSNFRIGINCQEVPPGSNRANESSNDGDSGAPKQRIFGVQSVLKDSPAEQVGIRPGDQVEMINSVPMDSVEQLVEAVQIAGRDKEKVVLEVLRGNEHLEFELQPVVLAELSFEDMRQAIPLPQYGENGQPTPQNNLPMTPQEMFQRSFPGGFSGGFPGWNDGQNQFGPGWVMNREELNELRRPQSSQSQPSKTDPEVIEQLSNLQREIAELKEMIKAMRKE
jgi:hypothetical protein